MPTEFFTALLVFAFGASIGSFLNVVIWRLPRDEQISQGRSHCPNCHAQLKSQDLIPIISFLWRRGRCAYCRKKISLRYPIIELVVGALYAAAFYFFSPTDPISWFILVQTFFVIAVLVVVFVIDLEHYLILDKVIWPATLAILLSTLAIDIWLGNGIYFSQTLQSLLGAIAGFLPFYLLWKISSGRWIGLGDAKFGLFLGAVFGLPLIFVNFFLAFFLGTIVAIPLLILGKKQLGSKLPLGTFLAVAALITLFYGQQMWDWYMGLIGFGL
jgi:leader peptidase (prepilin peptidase) / N-methyltransferase